MASLADDEEQDGMIVDHSVISYGYEPCARSCAHMKPHSSGRETQQKRPLSFKRLTDQKILIYEIVFLHWRLSSPHCDRARVSSGYLNTDSETKTFERKGDTVCSSPSSAMLSASPASTCHFLRSVAEPGQQ